jgi:Protein of unknown function (DUF4231)
MVWRNLLGRWDWAMAKAIPIWIPKMLPSTVTVLAREGEAFRSEWKSPFSIVTAKAREMSDDFEPKSEEYPHAAVGAGLAYINKRIDPQILWFNEKARSSKLLHYLFFGTAFVSTSCIVIANTTNMRWLTTALAVISSIANGFAGLVKFQENWIRYRGAAIALEGLKLKYELGVQPFSGANRDDRLIEEAEKVFSAEQSKWQQGSMSVPRTSKE